MSSKICLLEIVLIVDCLFFREEYNPFIQMDRVITVQYNLPAEQLTLNEDTMLSSQEEEALSKCSEAESMISRKAYECLKDIMKEVCRALSLRCFCIYLLHLSVLSWRKG